MALVVGLAVLPRVQNPGPGPAASASSAASAAVRTFLEAVADADADTALAQLSRVPADTTLLTDAVLERSR
ncbi:hypothetical protein ACFWZW_05095 [Microbacterium enclense]|uniref:hypothetical protein n=1 Tax=Microbacterium enclense TaxID=993073 RepID=UPI0036D8E605